MIPKEHFVYNLELCHSIKKNITGDYVECGVWKGGMSAAISEVIDKTSHIHLFDSFEGLPEAKEIDGKGALNYQKNTQSETYFDNCSAKEEFAMEAMKLAKNDNYSVHKGWFQDTLAKYPKNSISILRLDGDWYDSVKVCLNTLFPYVAEGGIIILDDYYAWEGCAKAVHEYLAEIKSASRIHQWKGHVPYIVKKEST